MAQPSSNHSSSNTITRYPDNPREGDVQIQAAETVNDSPTAAIPIPRDNTDLERGDDLAATLVNDEQPESSTSRSRWEGLTAMSLGAFSGEAAGRKPHEDQDG